MRRAAMAVVAVLSLAVGVGVVPVTPVSPAGAAYTAPVTAQKCVRWTSPPRWEVRIKSANLVQAVPGGFATPHHDVWGTGGQFLAGSGGNYWSPVLRILLPLVNGVAIEPGSLQEWRPNVPDAQFTGSYTQLDYNVWLGFSPNTTACNPGQPGYSAWIGNA